MKLTRFEQREFHDSLISCNKVLTVYSICLSLSEVLYASLIVVDPLNKPTANHSSGEMSTKKDGKFYDFLF